MKYKKIRILSLMLSFPVLTGAVISCGHKGSGPTRHPVSKLIPLEPTNQVKWSQFKSLATSASATQLKNQLSATQLTSYHWKNDDVAMFWFDNSKYFNHHFIVNDQAKTIITYIVIKDALPNVQHPIIINIDYQNLDYNIKNWTFKSYDPQYNASWTAFKKAINIADTPNNITKNGLKTKQIPRWNTQNIGEWDTYGASNVGTTPYFKGMDGALKIDDAHHSASGIVSIKNQGDTLQAYPFKVFITQQKDQAYNLDNWVITPTTQLQSRDAFSKTAQAFSQNLDAFLANNGLKQRLIDSYGADPNRAFTLNHFRIQYSDNTILYKVLLNVNFFDKSGNNSSKTVFNTLTLLTKNGAYGNAYQQKNWTLG